MGLTPLMLSLTCLTAMRNQRILTARDNHQQHHARPAAGQPARTRSRRRSELPGAAPAPP
jgi:hypothetical protein